MLLHTQLQLLLNLVSHFWFDLQIDDSATVEDLVNTICERVGISNANEYSLLDEETDQEKAVRFSISMYLPLKSCIANWCITQVLGQ